MELQEQLPVDFRDRKAASSRFGADAAVTFKNKEARDVQQRNTID